MGVSLPGKTKSVLTLAWHVSPYFASAGLLFMLATVMAYKIYLMSPAAAVPLFLSVPHHDSLIFGTVLILYGLAGFALHLGLPSALGFLLRAIVLAVSAIYLFDVAAFKFFNTRLYWADIVVFSRETDGIQSLLAVAGAKLFRMPWWKAIAIITVVLISVYIAITYLSRPITYRASQNRKFLFVGCLLVFFSTLTFPPSVYSYVDKPLYENVFERNSDYFNPKVYSDSFRRAVIDEYSDNMTCEIGRNERRNIVLLIVESLSSYHSNYFSGLNDYTPNLDEIAIRHTAFTNFHANGWTTIGGLISILTTSLPLVPEVADFNTWGSPRFEDFGSPRDSLPKLLRKEGYNTTFLAGGDLSFTNKGEWLKMIGFEEVIDGSEIEYSGSIRGPFKSVPDQTLILEATDRIARNPDKGPFFFVIETFWGHRPWISPAPDIPSTEGGTFRYIDEQIQLLHSSLDDLGYYESGGLLMIVGDHRAMEPFSAREVERFGTTAASRVPMVIVGNDLELPLTINEGFQQHDILPSIATMVSEEHCRSSYAGVFLKPQLEPPTCILHARGDDRDLVHAQCGDNEADVFIDGDDTRVVNGSLPNEEFVIKKVNYERIRED